MKDKPNWKKGDIVALLQTDGGVLQIFEAEHDPQYSSTILNLQIDWYYGLRNCKEIRLATIDDIDRKIKFQKESLELEQSRLDKLLNFRERLSEIYLEENK